MFQNLMFKKGLPEGENLLSKNNNNKNTRKNNEGKRDVDFLQRNASLNIENINQKSKKKIEENYGLTPTSSNQSIEKEDLNDDSSYRTVSVSTEYSSCKSLVPEIVLDSMTYDKYLEKLKSKGIKEYNSKRESFCEGFF